MPNDEGGIQNLTVECGVDLPESYLNFLRQYGTMAGELRVFPLWFGVRAAVDVSQANCDYRVQELLPGWFAFGSSGGGEMLAFDTRTAQLWKVYAVPFMSMDESDALLIAEDFKSFVKAILFIQ